MGSTFKTSNQETFKLQTFLFLNLFRHPKPMNLSLSLPSISKLSHIFTHKHFYNICILTTQTHKISTKNNIACTNTKKHTFVTQPTQHYHNSHKLWHVQRSPTFVLENNMNPKIPPFANTTPNVVKPFSNIDFLSRPSSTH